MAAKIPSPLKDILKVGGVFFLTLILIFASYLLWNFWANPPGRQLGGRKKITRLYLKEMVSALNEYREDCGTYPKALGALVDNSEFCENFVPKKYSGEIKTIKKDPYGCELFYIFDQEVTLKSLGMGCSEGGDGEHADVLAEF